MAIKSLEDLRKIKAQAKEHTEARKLNERQIIIGMGTCGIAAGAREVMKAVLEELAKRDIHDVAVLQTGCIGMCQKEPAKTESPTDRSSRRTFRASSRTISSTASSSKILSLPRSRASRRNRPKGGDILWLS